MKHNALGFPLLAQPERGYRYSIDAYLLAGFAGRFSADRWCDLGTGCGIIAYLLARTLRPSRGWAIERQSSLCALARKNLSGLNVRVIEGDIRDYPWHKHQFDLLVCNPPFYPANAGRLNRHRHAAEARHCLFGDISAFIDSSTVALHANGVFCLILPVDLWHKKKPELVRSPWRVLSTLTVHSFAEKPAKLICVALGRNSRPAQQATRLVLYAGHRYYSAEAQAFFAPLRNRATDEDNQPRAQDVFATDAGFELE